jgi:hypothetical protein
MSNYKQELTPYSYAQAKEGFISTASSTQSKPTSRNSKAAPMNAEKISAFKAVAEEEKKSEGQTKKLKLA